MRKIMYLILVLLLLIVGCTELGKLSDEDLERIAEKAIVCNEPYMRFEIGCCLDTNKNNVCDNHEEAIVLEETNETEESIQVETTEREVVIEEPKEEDKEQPIEVETIEEKEEEPIEFSSCTIGPGLACGEFRANDKGRVIIYVRNGLSKDIKYTTMDLVSTNDCLGEGDSKTIKAGQQELYAFHCMDNLDVGERFEANIMFTYTVENEIILTGEITTEIQEEETIEVRTTFKETNDTICEEYGKPIIRLFSTTTCPHCQIIKDTYDSTVKEYVDDGKIIAYHWEMDTGDNTLTTIKEGRIPSEEYEIFGKYSSGGVPTYVFGCRFVRIGNGYEYYNESANFSLSIDLIAEDAEFRDVIEKLIQEAVTKWGRKYEQ